MHTVDDLQQASSTTAGTAPSAPSADAGAPASSPDAGPASVFECEGSETRACRTSCESSGTQRCIDATWGPCEPPRELCDDGVDDDCDGRVDHLDPECTPIVRRCEDTEGGGCNGDLGSGDHCAPEDNTGGCSAARFHAWCNRRNPEFPDLWDRWIIDWVDSRCDGTVVDDGANYTTYACLDSSNQRFECTTPLVLAFDDVPVRFTSSSGRFAFSPGAPLRTDWPSAATPWLVRDLDGDGRVTSGRELFGSDTLLADGRTARHGFEALAALDENEDGVVDARDSGFVTLRTWRDADGDRLVDDGELRPLSADGVTSLSLAFVTTPQCDTRGNCERERAGFSFSRGGATQTGALIDVWLRVRPSPQL